MRRSRLRIDLKNPHFTLLSQSDLVGWKSESGESKRFEAGRQSAVISQRLPEWFGFSILSGLPWWRGG